jgi:hypothetical protein
MNPITALMLARTVEDDIRRDVERRRIIASRGPSPKPPREASSGRLGWLPRLARLGLAASRS